MKKDNNFYALTGLFTTRLLYGAFLVFVFIPFGVTGRAVMAIVFVVVGIYAIMKFRTYLVRRPAQNEAEEGEDYYD